MLNIAELQFVEEMDIDTITYTAQTTMNGESYTIKVSTTTIFSDIPTVLTATNERTGREWRTDSESGLESIKEMFGEKILEWVEDHRQTVVNILQAQ